jgi:hypothetical protein
MSHSYTNLLYHIVFAISDFIGKFKSNYAILSPAPKNGPG